jgi:PE family
MALGSLGPLPAEVGVSIVRGHGFCAKASIADVSIFPQETELSYLIATPEMFAAAAADAAGIGSSLSQARAVAAVSTTGVVAAAGDEVSAAIAATFSGYGQQYRALSAQAAAFHAEFVQALIGAGSSYGLAEAGSWVSMISAKVSLTFLAPLTAWRASFSDWISGDTNDRIA